MTATLDHEVAALRRANAELQRRLDEHTVELKARTAERDEAQAQQTATAEVLQVINSSPGDLAPVFNVMLEKAMRLCEAAFGIFWTHDGGRLNAVAMRGVPAAFENFAGEPLRPGSETGLGRLLRGERFIHITDISADEVYRSRDKLRVATVELGGARTLLLVPLRKDDALLGIVSVYRQEVRPFNDKQIALLENFAAQAVIAIENARLITETREALEQQTATSEILRVISRSPTDLQPTFDAIAARATTLCGGASGSVFRFDGSMIHFAAHYGWGAEELKAVQSAYPMSPGPRSMTARAILSGHVAHSTDVGDDTSVHPTLARAFHTALSVPMLRDGKVLGAVTVTRRQVEPFTEAQIDLLRTFADQAVIAIENVAALHRIGRGTRPADRDRRGAGGHQFLARRPRAGLRRDAGKSLGFVQRRIRCVVDL